MSTTASGDDAIHTCAAQLALAESSRRPVPPIRKTFPQLALAEAYEIQRTNASRRTQRGERVVGHKVGLTARAMQELFGVHEPDYGHLFDTMLHAASRPLDLSELIDPQIEVEPAFVLARTLCGPGLQTSDVISATDYVCVCFEVIDSRIADWDIRIQDTVADNGSSARVVLGSNKVKPSDIDLGDLNTELALNGIIAERGNTSAILGHPAAGVAWLANTLAQFGVSLQAGDIVLPGTCTRSRRIAGYRSAAGRIAGLGEVAVELTGEPFVKAAACKHA